METRIPHGEEPYTGAHRPTTIRSRLGRLLQRWSGYFATHVLHLDDTPGRIALGVAIGFFIAFTPTIGIQMVLYLAVVAVLPANKVSGILPIWVTNPLTAAPIYYFNWRVGTFLLTGRIETSPASRAAIERLIEGDPSRDIGFFERLFDPQFWSAAAALLGRIGGELWVGSLFVGLVAAVVGGWITLRVLRAYRNRR